MCKTLKNKESIYIYMYICTWRGAGRGHAPPPKFLKKNNFKGGKKNLKNKKI
jgi:hypothetical protein